MSSLFLMLIDPSGGNGPAGDGDGGERQADAREVEARSEPDGRGHNKLSNVEDAHADLNNFMVEIVSGCIDKAVGVPDEAGVEQSCSQTSSLERIRGPVGRSIRPMFDSPSTDDDESVRSWGSNGSEYLLEEIDRNLRDDGSRSELSNRDDGEGDEDSAGQDKDEEEDEDDDDASGSGAWHCNGRKRNLSAGDESCARKTPKEDTLSNEDGSDSDKSPLVENYEAYDDGTVYRWRNLPYGDYDPATDYRLEQFARRTNVTRSREFYFYLGLNDCEFVANHFRSGRFDKSVLDDTDSGGSVAEMAAGVGAKPVFVVVDSQTEYDGTVAKLGHLVRKSICKPVYAHGQDSFLRLDTHDGLVDTFLSRWCGELIFNKSSIRRFLAGRSYLRDGGILVPDMCKIHMLAISDQEAWRVAAAAEGTDFNNVEFWWFKTTSDLLATDAKEVFRYDLYELEADSTHLEQEATVLLTANVDFRCYGFMMYEEHLVPTTARHQIPSRSVSAIDNGPCKVGNRTSQACLFLPKPFDLCKGQIVSVTVKFKFRDVAAAEGMSVVVTGTAFDNCRCRKGQFHHTYQMRP